MELVEINKDSNGNPRCVVHFLSIASDRNRQDVKKNYPQSEYLKELYKIALKKSRSLGGKKYDNRNFGCGIVFQAWNKKQLQRDLIKLSKL